MRFSKLCAILLGLLLTQPALSPAWAVGLARVGIPLPSVWPSGATLSLYQLFTGCIIGGGGCQGYPNLSVLCTSPRTFSWAWSNQRTAAPDPTLGACVLQFEYVTSQHFAYWLSSNVYPEWMLEYHPDYIAYQPLFTFTANVSGTNLSSMSVDPTLPGNFAGGTAVGASGYYPIQETTVSGGITVPGSFVTSDTAGKIPYGTYINTLGTTGSFAATLSQSATGSASADTITVSTLATEFYTPAGFQDQLLAPLALGNPAALSFYESYIGQILLTGFAGVSFDNYGVVNNQNEGGYYSGVTTPCLPANWPACGGTWQPRYPNGQYDQTFAQDVINAGRSYVNFVHAYGVPVAFNTQINDSAAVGNEITAANVPDIALIESPTLTGGSGSTPSFQNNMATEFAVLSQVIKPLAVTDDNGWCPSWSVPYPSANAVQQQSAELSLSFALSLATPGSFWNMQCNCPSAFSTGCVGPVGTGDIGHYAKPDPLLAPNLGTITNATAAGTLVAGLLQRTLPGGMAFTNTTNGALSYTVPSGTWHDALSGASVSPGTYSLPAYSGRVLFNH